jgi:hypothetical protein
VGVEREDGGEMAGLDNSESSVLCALIHLERKELLNIQGKKCLLWGLPVQPANQQQEYRIS